MKTFYTHDEIKQRWSHIVQGIEEPSHRHFHFRPSRPANLLVTLDHITQELNVSAGTIGPLSWDPYTIVIHCAKSSLDSVSNIQQVGAFIFSLETPYPIPWIYSFLVLISICVLAGFVLKKKVKGVEIVK